MEIVAIGVLNSCVMLLMKSVLISDIFFWRIMTTILAPDESTMMRVKIREPIIRRESELSILPFCPGKNSSSAGSVIPADSAGNAGIVAVNKVETDVPQQETTLEQLKEENGRLKAEISRLKAENEQLRKAGR